MNSSVMYIFTVVGTCFVILSNYKAVCDVDPSDTASILLAQLKVQTKQLELDEKIISHQQKQLAIQNEQLQLLKDLNNRPNNEPAHVTILISVACTALGYAVLVLTKRFIKYLMIRYNIRPEMPQTPPPELMDFAPSSYQMEDVERLRSVRVMKSPASTYFSGESGDEE